jgi:hypothetical protein
MQCCRLHARAGGPVERNLLKSSLRGKKWLFQGASWRPFTDKTVLLIHNVRIRNILLALCYFESKMIMIVCPESYGSLAGDLYCEVSKSVFSRSYCYGLRDFDRCLQLDGLVSALGILAR